jgi:hypothetical protein
MRKVFFHFFIFFTFELSCTQEVPPPSFLSQVKKIEGSKRRGKGRW